MSIQTFLTECQKRHVTPVTLKNYTFCLRSLAEWADGKDIDKLSDSDLMSFLDANDRPSSYNLFRTVLRMYFAFIRGVDPKDILKGLKGKKAPIKELRLTPDHVQWYIDACGENYRDRALIAILAEYGFRAAEIMSIRNKDVEFDQISGGVYLTCPKGKTGTRRVLGINSTRHIASWLELHPKKNDPDWQFICQLDGRQFNDKVNLNNRFRKIEQRAKKMHPTIPHLHPHLLRHYAATNATKMKMTESSLKLRFGWTPTSVMPARYVHLTNQDSNDEYGELSGNRKKEERVIKTVEIPSVKVCPKCGFNQTNNLTYCPRCGSPMDLSAAIEKNAQLENKLKDYESRINALEEESDRLIEKLEKAQPGGLKNDPDFVEGGELSPEEREKAIKYLAQLMKKK